MSSSDEPPDRAAATVLDLSKPASELATVRHWCSHALPDMTEEELGDVLLVATELVTNAYDHGESARHIRVLRLDEPCAVRIEWTTSHAHCRFWASRRSTGPAAVD